VVLREVSLCAKPDAILSLLDLVIRVKRSLSLELLDSKEYLEKPPHLEHVARVLEMEIRRSGLLLLQRQHLREEPLEVHARLLRSQSKEKIINNK
jgi:hypothetical protein